MKVEGLTAVRDDDTGAIIYNDTSKVRLAQARKTRSAQINEQDKYIRILEKRLTRLENKVNSLIEEK